MEKGSGSPFDIMCATVRADASGRSACMCPRVSSFVCQPHSNPGSMTTISCPCCVGKGIHQVLPPSRHHAAAEAAFGDAVAKEVSRLGFTRLMCDAVQALDDQVQRGFVRRQAAARMASSGCVFGTGARHQYDSTLLRCVLQPYKHKTSDCKCVETVLAWGCCPTQVALCSDVRWGGYMSTALSLALPLCERRPQWVRALVTSGCIPCHFYRVVDNRSAGLVTLVPVPVITAWFKSHMLQWRRWHRRCCKRQWITASMVL